MRSSRVSQKAGSGAHAATVSRALAAGHHGPMEVARSTSIGTLTASWAALVRGSAGSVKWGPGFVAAHCKHEVFNNTLLLAPSAEAVAAAARFYESRHLRWSLWTGDAATSQVPLGGGFVAAGNTTDMARTLADLPPCSATPTVVSTTPAAVAKINGLSGRLLRGVTGFDAFTAGGESAGLLSFRHEDDVHLSFLATKPEHRKRGLASALVTAALHQARRCGAATVTLQATPAALSLYQRLGFTAIGEWHEWEPPSQ